MPRWHYCKHRREQIHPNCAACSSTLLRCIRCEAPNMENNRPTRLVSTDRGQAEPHLQLALPAAAMLLLLAVAASAATEWGPCDAHDSSRCCFSWHNWAYGKHAIGSHSQYNLVTVTKLVVVEVNGNQYCPYQPRTKTCHTWPASTLHHVAVLSAKLSFHPSGCCCAGCCSSPAS